MDVYKGPERRSGVSNGDISHQLTEFENKMREYVDNTFVTKSEFEERLARQTLDIVREVSKTTREMMTDAIGSTIHDSIVTNFRNLYEDQRKQDRQELVKSMASIINKTSTAARILQPLITIAGVLFGMWITGNT